MAAQRRHRPGWSAFGAGGATRDCPGAVHRMRGVKGAVVALVALVVASAACTTRTVVPAGEMAAVAPQLSVERFLQATQARDYDAMLRLFGTHDGPVDADDDRAYWERRMDLLARILDFNEYRIVSESSVPARPHPTTRVGVNLSFSDGTVPDVAFVTVQTDEGRWMVSEIDTEKVARR